MHDALGMVLACKKKHVRKTLCNSLVCLDSFEMFKKKSIGFIVKNDGLETTAKLTEAGFKVTNEGRTYLIPVEKQTCHFGGFRYFFRCPKYTCRQRMRKLYNYKGYFLCRKCLNLGYHTQTVSPAVRYLQMEDKVERIIERAGGDLHNKPKWMRKYTFKRLRDRCFDYSFRNHEATEREFKAIFGCSIREAFSTPRYSRRNRLK